jgi:hypothetical protein
MEREWSLRSAWGVCGFETRAASQPGLPWHVAAGNISANGLGRNFVSQLFLLPGCGKTA